MAKSTVIKASEVVTGGSSEKVSTLKDLIDNIYLPFSAQKAGDVALYDTQTNRIVYADADADFANDYPASQFTPIGVVAIPADHKTNGEGKNVVVSLKYMNYSTPDEGSVSSQTMCWGYNSLLLGKEFNVVVGAGTLTSSQSEATGTTSSNYLPSDIFSSRVCATDSKAYYYNTSTSSNSAAPSPYLEDESRNPVYSQTESPSSEANCLSDLDGKSNTQLMLDNVMVSNWKTANTISNSSSSGSYPAACVCWRFHTAGTNQGDWYLPACGELGYMMVRLKTINATIDKLIEAYGDDVAGEISTSSYHWSSTEYSSSYARFVFTSNGYVYCSRKNDSHGVRAFARL